MTWVAVAFAVFFAALAGGLYLQLRDALSLAREWKSTALLEGKRAQANLNLAEFAVRQLDPSEPLASLEEIQEFQRGLRAVD